MTLALTALLTLALGWPVVRALRAPGSVFGWIEALVLAAGLGLGMATLLQLLALHVTTARPWALEIVVAVALFAALPRAAGGGEPTPPPGEPDAPGRQRWRRLADVGLGALVLGLLVDHVRAFLGITLTAPFGQWDGKAIWNLKACFLFRAGLDWRDVTGDGLALSHVDYPWLLPLALLRGFQALGHESPALTQALAGAFGLGTLALVVCGLRRERGPLAGWLGGLVLLASPRLVAETSAQQADVPVAYFAVAMVSALASAGLGSRAPLAIAGLCGGLAAWTKNEGAVWLAGAGVAVTVAGLRRAGLREKLVRPVWFAAGALPGLLVLLFFKLAVAGPNDLAGMTTASAVLGRILEPTRWWTVAEAVWTLGLDANTGLVPLVGPGALVLAPIMLGARTHVGAPGAWTATLAVGACGLGLLTIFVATPVDLAWHLGSSAGRLMLQLWPAAIFASLLWVPSTKPPPTFT